MHDLRILVVDDEPAVREATEMILELGGYHIAGSARNGEEAVAFVDHEAPDAILMDVRMPRIGGIEATRMIISLRPEIRIVIFSAYDDPELKQAAFNAGAHDFLIKGCDAAELIDAFAS